MRPFRRLWPRPRSAATPRRTRPWTSPAATVPTSWRSWRPSPSVIKIDLEDIYVQGLDGIAKDDIRYGREMGYRLKLLAIALRNEEGRISLRVHPSFIAADSPLARVDGSFNAISVFGSAVGETFYYGRGAGMMPTASAVVADLIDVALGNSRTTFEHLRLRPREEITPLLEKIDDSVSRFYVRVMAKDRARCGCPLRQDPRRPPDQHLRGPATRRSRPLEYAYPW